MIQYLASKHNIPPHKIYLIGLGKDKPVDSNKTRDGRAKNRRVDVRLMTNSADAAAPAQQPDRACSHSSAIYVRLLVRGFLFTPAAPRPPWSSFFVQSRSALQ